MRAHFYHSFPHCFSECLSKQVYGWISCTRTTGHHWAAVCCSVSAPSLVTGVATAWSQLAPRTWPGLASHVQGSPAQTARNTNSKMVRNQKSVSQNLKDPYIFLVPSEGPLPTGQPLLHVSGLPCLGAAPMTQDITADKITQSDTISTFTGSQP